MLSVPQELLGASRVVAKGSVGRGAKAATDAVKDKVEDVQEAWETSQVMIVTCSFVPCVLRRVAGRLFVPVPSPLLVPNSRGV